MVGGLLFAMIFTVGCGSLPWSKKKDNIYSPKPAYQKDKKSKKNKPKLAETVDDFMGLERSTW